MGSSSRTLRMALACGFVGLSACAPAPLTGPTPRRPRPPVMAAASASPGGLASSPGGLAPSPLGSAPVGVASTTGGPLIGMDGASVQALAGVVRAPARLISDNGLGVVANNGGSIIANNGLGLVANNGGGFVVRPRYRLAAAGSTEGELPVEGAVVALRMPGGQLVVDEAGQPLTARTGPDGRYAFGLVPDGSFFVTVELGAASGRLAAIAPKPASGARPAIDLDLASSLAATYVAAAYLATVPDPRAALDRLPADVAAATREKTRQALAAGAAPPSLTEPAVRTAVDALRAKDAALDAQLEDVRRILIAAGQADLGAGRPGTEVKLTRVAALCAGEDGALFFSCPSDRRVWRLGADGRLATAAGDGSLGGLSDLTGVKGPQAPLLPVAALSWDPRNRRLMLFEDLAVGDAQDVVNTARPFMRRVAWLDAGGTLTEWLRSPAFTAAFPLDDAYLTFGDGGAKRQAPGREPTAVAGFPAGFAPKRVGRAADGTIVAATADGKLWRFAAPGFAGELVDAPATGGYAAIAVDAGGHALMRDASGRVRLRRAGQAAPEVVLAAAPAAWGPGLPPFAVGSDGKLHVAADARVWRIEGGAATVVAGVDPAAGGTGGAGALVDRALDGPAGLATGPDGAVYVAESGTKAVSKVGADRTLAVAFTAGEAFASGPVFVGGARSPGKLQLDRAGTLYALGAQGVLRGAAGALGAFYAPAAGKVADFAVTPAGKVFVLEGGAIYAVGADGQRGEAVFVPDAAGSATALAAGPGEQLTYVTGLEANGEPYRLWRLTPGGLPAMLGEEPASGAKLPGPLHPAGACAVASDGTFYVASALAHTITRYAAPGWKAEAFAGAGTARLGGSGVDDGLREPEDLAFGPDGDLFVLDVGHRQLKRVPTGP